MKPSNNSNLNVKEEAKRSIHRLNEISASKDLNKKTKKDFSFNSVQSYRILIMSFILLVGFRFTLNAQSELLLGERNNVMKYAIGRVYLANGDSLKGALKIKTNRFGVETLVVKNNEGNRVLLTPSEIKYFVHRKEEYVPYDGMFLQILLEGKIRLYKHTHAANHYHMFLTDPTQIVGGAGIYMDEYVVLKNGEMIKIKLTDKEKGYHKKMIKVFGDDQELRSKIINKNYRRGDFSQMIAFYNHKHY